MDIPPQAALNPIRRCARSRSLLSLLTRLAAKRRRRGRLGAMTTCRNPSVRVNCWRKFANSCNSGQHNCCGAQCLLLAQSGHHSPTDPCPLLGVKRTSVAPSLECAPNGGHLAGMELTKAAGLSEDESHGQTTFP